MSLVDRISQYTKSKGKARPLNCLVLAKPGSGKSFFTKQVEKATGCEMVEVNCSQMTSPEDLLESIAQLNDVKDKTPLLFLDEVDTNEEFYPFLLAPLWDGSVLVNGKTKRWSERFISILVASNNNFLTNLRDPNTKKGADLLSRLNGPRLTLSEQGLEQKSNQELEQILTSRVYLTADMLLRYHDTARIVERGLLDLVYCAPDFNPRAVEHFIASLPTPADGIVSLKNVRDERLKEFAENLGYQISDDLKNMQFIIPDGLAKSALLYQEQEKIITLKKLSQIPIHLIKDTKKI